MPYVKGETAREKNSKWKGGIKIHGYGYRLVASPDHPFKDKQGYVREHRLVMEKHLGRYLRLDELVHHKNHIKTDNRIENLELTTRSEHKKLDHPEIGKSTRFAKGDPRSNYRNGKEIPCIICGKMFYVPKGLLSYRKTCGNIECKKNNLKNKMTGNNYAQL